MTRDRTVCLQRWTDLLFVHWRYPVDVARRVVPAPLEVDAFDGAAWVGIVAFEIRAARPPLLPPSAGLDFPETNVRTYVRRPDGVPGVLFLSLDAASRAMVAGGRLRYGLPYHRAAMRVVREGASRRWESERSADPSARFGARARIGRRIGPAHEGLDRFLVERYALHVARDGRVRTVAVRHEPYPLREVEDPEVEQTLLEAAGLPPPAGVPASIRYAERVEAVIVEPGDGMPEPGRAPYLRNMPARRTETDDPA